MSILSVSQKGYTRDGEPFSGDVPTFSNYYVWPRYVGRSKLLPLQLKIEMMPLIKAIWVIVRMSVAVIGQWYTGTSHRSVVAGSPTTGEGGTSVMYFVRGLVNVIVTTKTIEICKRN